MHQDTPRFHRKELVFFEESNPRAVANMVPESVKVLMRHLWESKERNLLKYGERELLKIMVREGKSPRALDHRIRLQFWNEYERVQNEVVKYPTMNFSNVIGFAIPKETFYTHYITDPHRLAWMLCPIQKYVEYLEDCLAFSVECVREIIEEGTRKITSKEEPFTRVFGDFVLAAQNRMHLQVRGLKGPEPKEKVEALDEEPEEEALPGLTEEEVLAAKRARIAALKKIAETQAPPAPREDGGADE